MRERQKRERMKAMDKRVCERESQRGNEIARAMEREKESGWQTGAKATREEKKRFNRQKFQKSLLRRRNSLTIKNSEISCTCVKIRESPWEDTVSFEFYNRPSTVVASLRNIFEKKWYTSNTVTVAPNNHNHRDFVIRLAIAINRVNERGKFLKQFSQWEQMETFQWLYY